MSQIIYVSDFDLKGSGYMNISVSVCKGLAEKGHDLKVIGLGYAGTEHDFPFGIIPARNLAEVLVMINNLRHLWNPSPQIAIIALDIPMQESALANLKGVGLPYIGIMPIESDPLCMSWAAVLMQMDGVFIISDFGTKEAKKMGIDAEHIQVGIDTESWRIPEADERKALRKNLAFGDDEFVVLCVADNQERKLLSKTFEIVSKFRQEHHDKTTLILVTREHLRVGWKLRDLAADVDYKISDKFMLFERGLPFKELWSLYALADVFLLTSKAEGLGMPILEAQAVGLPVVATGATAIMDHISDGRGYPIDIEHDIRDPFGNGRRYVVDADHGVKQLLSVLDDQGRGVSATISKALEYIKERDWSITVDAVNNKVKEILDGK